MATEPSTIRALCLAESFGYGPASKLEHLLSFFPRSRFALTFFGNGTGWELLQDGNFERTVYGDPTDLSEDSSLVEEMSRHDLLVTSMEFLPCRKARAMGLKVIIFDSLFWMWDPLPVALDAADLYICQNFIGVQERVAAEREKEVNEFSRIVAIPPLIGNCGLLKGAVHSSDRGPVGILNFGGMDNPSADREGLLKYASVMTRTVYSVCREQGFSLKVCGRKWVMDFLRENNRNPGITFQSCSLPLFLTELQKASFIFTSPGLEVTYEAFASKIPVFFLPPQNNSQLFQFRLIRAHCLSFYGFQWSDIIDDVDVSENSLFFSVEESGFGSDQDDVVREMLLCARLFHDSVHYQKKARTAMTRFFENPGRDRNSIIRGQSELFHRLCEGKEIIPFKKLRSLIASVCETAECEDILIRKE